MKAGDPQRLKELLRQWHNHALPPPLQKELLGLLERGDLGDPLATEMKEIWEETEGAEVFDTAQKEAMLASITAHRQPKRFSIRYVAAAAVLVVVIVTGILLWRRPAETSTAAGKQIRPSVQPTDITAPATNKATLTLADGRRIVVENSGEGSLATEGNVEVVKKADGQLVYEGSATGVKWNTLSVPRGSKPMHLSLADGSQVTLNVASSLTYPTAFSGSSRQVTMSGEAYFEIAKMPAAGGGGKLPFVVSLNGMSVEVSGTKFNVNAYEDEAATKTTLVEGSVNVVAGKRRQVVAPGEQAVVATNGPNEIELNKKADVKEAMAWVNGKFRFDGAGVETVMRQVARWYDVEVRFAARPRMRFGGQIDRNSTLRQVFTILETSGLHFSLSGKVVTILP